MSTLFSYIFFPGFVFTALLGIIASGIDRKVTARIQWRQGPPLLQPLYDFIKLLGKETLVPAGASKLTFLITPVFGLAAVSIVSTILWGALINPKESFVGDFIVVLYLLAIPSLSIIIGGFASRNRIASLGASREMKFILSYELPFIMVLLIPVIQTGNIRLGDIVTAQMSSGLSVGTVSGFIALLAGILCIQAKLGLVPFDASEAEQEIVAGPFIEYSGTPLAIFKLTKWMMLVTLPLFLVVMYMPSSNPVHIAIRYIIILVLTILIRNTNPRLRIDQVMRFFWTKVAFVSLIAVILALLKL